MAKEDRADHGAGLSVDGLSKTFLGTRALDSVTLRVRPGRIHALLGGNGSGKSTLIKILAGVQPGDPGGVIKMDGNAIASAMVSPRWAREAGLSFVHQDLGLFPPMSVAENLFVGQPYPRASGRIGWRTMNRIAAAQLADLSLDLDPQALVSSLRPAQATLVAIARALRGREHHHGGVLVLDEPTARLPRAEVDELIDALRRFANAGQAIVFVSHRLDEVLEVADDVSVLRDGRLVHSTAADGLDRRALTRIIVGHDLEVGSRRNLVSSVAGAECTEPALEVRGLSAGRVSGLDLQVQPGEVVGVAGLVGSGRTSLLEAVFGASPRAGQVIVRGHTLSGSSIKAAMRAGLAYVPEDRAGSSAFSTMSVAENISAADLQRYREPQGFSHSRLMQDARRDITRYAIKTADAESPFALMSGGNQQKAVVARWLRRQPAVLLLDEPTQGVDVGAREAIYEQVEEAAARGCAVLLVSSDLDEVMRLSHRIAVMVKGRLVAEAATADKDRAWLAQRVYETESEI